MQATAIHMRRYEVASALVVRRYEVAIALVVVSLREVVGRFLTFDILRIRNDNGGVRNDNVRFRMKGGEIQWMIALSPHHGGAPRNDKGG